MEYTQKTADLIDKMCELAQRDSFRLNKKKAQEYILQTYDIFGLERPKNVVWVKDIFDKDFERSALSDRSTLSARSAGSASSARSALSARSTMSASSAWSAWSAGIALSARSTLSASSAWSVWSISWTALDEDFYYFVFEYEYVQNPDEKYKTNEHDYKYIEYSELLMKAIEAGAGYRVEWEDTLYISPTPLVKIDQLNRFHSLKSPAIRWEGGREFYYISGVKLDKKLWKKITSGEMSASEVFAIENQEQRRVAYEQMDKSKMKELADFKILDEVKDDGCGNPMKIFEFSVEGFDEPFKYVNWFCPSTKREYFHDISGTDITDCWIAKNNSFRLPKGVKIGKEW